MKFALFQPDIAQNFGAAIRLSACFDVPLCVIEPCGFPLSSRDIRRASMDYNAQAMVSRFSDWDDFTLAQRPSRLILLTTKSQQQISDFEFRTNDCLVFGRESAGAPTIIHESCDARLSIPIAAPARSLNLATACAITLFEALRQTGGLAYDQAQ